jgi:hypothetical protein
MPTERIEPLFSSVGDLCRAMIHDDPTALADAIRAWCGSPLEVTEIREGLTALIARLTDAE